MLFCFQREARHQLDTAHLCPENSLSAHRPDHPITGELGRALGRLVFPRQPHLLRLGLLAEPLNLQKSVLIHPEVTYRASRNLHCVCNKTLHPPEYEILETRGARQQAMNTTTHMSYEFACFCKRWHARSRPLCLARHHHRHHRHIM